MKNERGVCQKGNVNVRSKGEFLNQNEGVKERHKEYFEELMCETR